MCKKVLLILLSIWLQSAFSQQFTKPILYECKIDSLVISTLISFSKENSNIGDTIQQTRIIKGKRENLSSTEILDLNRVLESRRSYSKNGVALLNDYDVRIEYYFDGKLMEDILISSITIKTEKCRSFSDLKSQEINLCIFLGRISTKFELYLTHLLVKKGLWKKGKIDFLK